MGNRVRLWSSLLQVEGVKPEFTSLYVADDAVAARALERSAIQRFSAAGVPLLNTLHAVRRLSLAHVRLRAVCPHEDDLWNRLVQEKLFPYLAPVVWKGGVPDPKEVSRYQEIFGIAPTDWLAVA